MFKIKKTIIAAIIISVSLVLSYHNVFADLKSNTVEIAFADTRVNEVSQITRVTINVINSGHNVVMSISGGDFTTDMDVLEFRADVGDGLEIGVLFKPKSVGQKTEKLVFSDKDTKSELLSIELKGNAIAPQSVNGNGNINDGGGGRIFINYFNPIGGTDMTVTDLVKNIINGIFGLLGAVAVAMIVYGGTRYLTAAGNDKNVEKAKSILTSAIVGLVITLLSLAIVDLLFVLLAG